MNAGVDTNLMISLQRGDEQALSVLVDRNYEKVLAFAQRYLGDPHQAEDAAQETFLRVYRARDRYQPLQRFRAYLLTIAANVCATTWKKRSTRAKREERALPPLPQRTPSFGVRREELRQRVGRALATLPATQRQAIELLLFERKSYQEIGDELGLTLPATRSVVFRARRRLQGLLGELHPAR